MVREQDIVRNKVIKDSIIGILNFIITQKKIAQVWTGLLSYKIPFSLVAEDLYNKKEKTVKTKKGLKKKQISIKPKRPSTKIEVIYTRERELLSAFESVWAEMSDYTKTFKAAGVAASEVRNVLQTLRGFVTKKWEIVRKFSAPLKKRSDAILKIAKMADKSINVVNKRALTLCLTQLIDFPDSVNSDLRYHLSSCEVLQAMNYGDITVRNLNNLVRKRYIVSSLRNLISQDKSWEELESLIEENCITLGVTEDFTKTLDQAKANEAIDDKKNKKKNSKPSKAKNITNEEFQDDLIEKGQTEYYENFTDPPTEED